MLAQLVLIPISTKALAHVERDRLRRAVLQVHFHIHRRETSPSDVLDLEIVSSIRCLAMGLVKGWVIKVVCHLCDVLQYLGRSIDVNTESVNRLAVSGLLAGERLCGGLKLEHLILRSDFSVVQRLDTGL